MRNHQPLQEPHISVFSAIAFACNLHILKICSFGMSALFMPQEPFAVNAWGIAPDDPRQKKNECHAWSSYPNPESVSCPDADVVGFCDGYRLWFRRKLSDIIRICRSGEANSWKRGCDEAIREKIPPLQFDRRQCIVSFTLNEILCRLNALSVNKFAAIGFLVLHNRLFRIDTQPFWR